MSDDRDLKVKREELHDALRFVYAMSMQSKAQLDNMDAVLAALVKVLLESGALDRRRVDALLPEATRRVTARANTELTVDVAPNEDKYAVESPADLDCAALLPICEGRCCRLTFPLSFQDLEEGGIEWEYSLPYRNRQRDDGYCVHSDADRRCSVYERRPAVCRGYDCRGDERIWQDFDKKIPAPRGAVKPPEKLYDIRRPHDGASRMDEPD